MTEDEKIELADELVERIKPILAGHPPEVQGLVLADCLSRFIAGHVERGNRAATRKFQSDLLKFHIDKVRKLIPIAAKIIGAEPD